MRRTIGVVAAFATASALVFAAVPALTADLGASVLKARQDVMKEHGADMKAINEALEAATFDAAAVQQAAARLEDRVQNLHYLFAPGTGMADNIGKSSAKAEIWGQWDKFIEASDVMEDEAAELVQVAATGDKDAIMAAFGELGKNGCGGCHSPFRQKQE
jgi:cytochrome c556